MSKIMLWVPKYQQWMSLEEISYRRMLKKDVPQEHLKSAELQETPLTCRAKPGQDLENRGISDSFFGDGARSDL